MSREGYYRKKRGSTYSVTSTEFFLSSNNSSASLGSIERTLSLNGGLSGSSAATSLASNLSDGIPVVHDVGLLT